MGRRQTDQRRDVLAGQQQGKGSIRAGVGGSIPRPSPLRGLPSWPTFKIELKPRLLLFDGSQHCKARDYTGRAKLRPEHSSSDTLLNLPKYGRCRRPVARDAGSTCLDPRPIPFCRLRVDRGRGSDVMSFRRWLEIVAGMLALGAAVFWLLSASPWEPFPRMLQHWTFIPETDPFHQAMLFSARMSGYAALCSCAAALVAAARL